MATMQRSKLRQAIHTWKQKAIRRGKQLKLANKRLRDLAQSRDRWKGKAQARLAQLAQFHAEIQRLKGAKKIGRPPLPICAQPANHPDAHCPQIADVSQFSSRLEKQ